VAKIVQRAGANELPRQGKNQRPEFGETTRRFTGSAPSRQLRRAYWEIGYIHLQAPWGRFPTRASLDYIARLTGEATGKVLNAVDGALMGRTGWASACEA
jgi:hypothetical protein